MSEEIHTHHKKDKLNISKESYFIISNMYAKEYIDVFNIFIRNYCTKKP